MWGLEFLIIVLLCLRLSGCMIHSFVNVYLGHVTSRWTGVFNKVLCYVSRISVHGIVFSFNLEHVVILYVNSLAEIALAMNVHGHNAHVLRLSITLIEWTMCAGLEPLVSRIALNGSIILMKIAYR